MDGFLLIDKPAGCTSRDACVQVGRALGLRTGRRGTRIGHAGTLDPFATGLLVIAVGRATRLMQYVSGQDKQYLVDVMLGVASSTDDITGKVISAPIRDDADLTIAALQEVVETIASRTVQVPPAVSALHVNGVRAYARVRRGEHVVMEPRPVRFESVTVTGVRDVDGLPVISLDVQCGAGTYMRSLARDLGAELGGGGVASSLRRVQSGTLHVRNAQPLTHISADSVCPMGAMVSALQRVQVTSDQMRDLAHGRAVEVPAPDVQVASAGDELTHPGTGGQRIAMVGPAKELIAVGHVRLVEAGVATLVPDTVVVRPDEVAEGQHKHEVV